MHSVSSQRDNMESENISDPYQDNRDVIQSPQSLQSTKEESRASSFQKHKKNYRDKIGDEGEKDSCVESRSKTRTCHSDPDRDQVSDGEGQRSSRSFYSEDYENESPSDRSISPYSQSRTPSPTPQRGVRAKRIYNSPLYKTVGVGRRGVSRPQRPGGQPLSQQHRRGMHSQSKESTPPKDLDLVTKRMLSARLLKINELRNSLAELQQRTDELQKENRVLRQLQVRQEKALHRYDDTESEISQLLSRHNNETHVLRERLRRTQERERAAERRMKDSEEQLQRSQGTIARLKKLVDQRELGTRDELSRRLEEEKTRAQEAERKIKELERSMELSSSSYQRQLAAERKKTISAQEEIRTLQEELERLTNKLKEKERELDAKNIYANRVMKPALRKDVDSGTKRKVPSRSSTKAVQTQDRTSSVDFPTPPPAITDANEYIEHAPDEYLSLKQELNGVDRQAETEDRHQKWEQQKTRDREKDRDKEEELVKEKDKELEREEKRQLKEELNVLEEKANRLRDGWEKTKEEEDRKRTSSLLNQEEENKRKRGHVQEEVQRWNQEVLANQQAAAEARRKKEQLLAKMREIDGQDHGTQDTMFAESSPSKATSNYSSPQQKNLNSSFFNHTESEDSASLHAGAGSGEGRRRRSGMEGGAATTGVGRRAPRPQISSDDLAFGSYAPSFGRSASRGSSGFPPPPPKEDRDSALEAIGVFSLRGAETEKEKETERGSGKERKSSLMQQLFGALATPACDSVSTSNKMEVLNSPTTNGVRSRREGLLSFNSGSSTPPASSLNTLHVAESRPAIRAITSFDDDIEELTL
ncbi:lebercilin isoform X1 [Sander lucioperca]|uniref:lebercilin isoform X1 n=2 Tax=Sander lucioperca TaxID=283035 RepID=UPI001653E0DD|nr:lebercilin isoform X1 [Sander lucioperca]XP_035851257.1 lebercilin isoform X1 [Sander lucioperca]XP_035851259.1 lebercilin isoform X1 [Sander lucioperca]XP_035851260.1 lebercilin isoform X1 [Sander lucioperca]